MQADNLAPFTEPRVWLYLVQGLLVTVQAGALAIVASTVVGTALAIARLVAFAPLRAGLGAYVDIVRSLPSYLIVMGVFFGVYRLGMELPPLIATALGLTVYHGAKNAEVIRGGIQSIERGQIEAARSLGLTAAQTMRLVILPQAFRRILPPLVGEFVLVIMGTAYGSLVGLDDLLRRGAVLYDRYLNPLETLAIVALLYWALCYGLSCLSRRLELEAPTQRRAAPKRKELRWQWASGLALIPVVRRGGRPKIAGRLGGRTTC